MAEKTKAQLMEELAALRADAEAKDAALAAKENELEAQRQKNLELARRGEGWLIRTPDPGFEGTRNGIRFQYGQAFILRDQKVTAFDFKPQGDGELKRAIMAQFPSAFYSDADRKAAYEAVREREKVSSAERAAESFEKDLGYEVTWYGVEQLESLDQDIADHAQKAAAILKAREDREQVEMISNPLGI